MSDQTDQADKATQEEVNGTLTLKEVQARTGLSMVYIRRRITTGKWTSFLDDSGRRRIPTCEVEEWKKWRKEADAKTADRKVAKVAAAKAKAEKAADKAAQQAEVDSVKGEL